MFRRVTQWLIVLCGIVVLSAAAQAGEVTLKDQKDKASYGIGVDMAKSLQQMGADVNPDALIMGIRDALANRKLQLSDEELGAAMNKFQTDMRQKQAAAQRTSGEANKKAGDAFLAENKGKPGVVTLPSGLQYKILKEGTGKKPTESDTVECNYRGTLINGTEFDSSSRHGQSVSFTLKDVIPGWREALKLMPVGSKWQLFVPPQLAYGDRGVGGQIGPNSTLIFEVELLAVK
ncbi:MAG TPA: FKBP-type peptidyl-prolyl cis-trans isomerase [Candidatus Baltobacteraceae bacterium]|nr:FKBP-type peptidyl-prolyl cis-trans isomerase [Candidatus Baltobacteraceae bacterium]